MRDSKPTRTLARNKPKETTRGTSESAAGDRSELFPIVGIGASAGGLEAFSELLRTLPEKTDMAFVLVQHLDPSHGSALPEVLSRATKLQVKEVTDGMRVERDHVYVIPANRDMIIKGGVLRLAARALTRGQHLPIDSFLQSLAQDRGDYAISVILSGTASDGTQGCGAVKAAGGITFAQDDKSARYTGMPQSAIHAGCIDFVRSPKEIAQELMRVGRHLSAAHAEVLRERQTAIAERREMSAVLDLVRQRTGVDFAQYKQSTLQRRIKRRMVLHHVERLKEYVRFVRNHPAESDELYREILIHVTEFFRDPEAFEALQKHVFPALLKNRKAENGPIRIWVPGCSTGEEVYSIAILLLEHLREQARRTPTLDVSPGAVQIFATDISDSALERARTGFYRQAEVEEISAERLKRFFEPLEGGYQIIKSVREICIFAKQDLTKDPPFSNLDLVTCRNLLIYLGPALQDRVIPMLHYALKPGGYLMLGGSETLGTYAEYFALIDKKFRIYEKKKSARRMIGTFAGTDFALRRPAKMEASRAAAHRAGFTVDKEVDRVLVNRYVPASIVVNEDMEIVEFRGKTGAYLEPGTGHPTFSLSKMAREGLLVDLRGAIIEAQTRNAPARAEGVRVRSNGGFREIDLEVIPLEGHAPGQRLFIVVFQEPAVGGRRTSARRSFSKASRNKREAARQKDRESEVQQLRTQLETLIEEHETTMEEFKTANEEVLSANEELQSTNEEMETAKEELQSSNEELTTLNEELQNRNTELIMANNDLGNLLANASIPIVMLGSDLRIRRFTPPAEKLLNLIAGDVGRRVGEIRPNLESEDLEHLARQAIDKGAVQEQEVRTKEGAWHLMRVRPYNTWDHKIDGAVISFLDIDSIKRNLERVQLYADTLIESARECILILDERLRVTVANPAFYRTFETSREETEGHTIYELGNKQWNIPRLRELLQEVTKSNTRVDDFEVQHDFERLGTRNMLLNGRRIEPQPGQFRIFLHIEDVTEYRKREDALRRQAALLDLAHDAILIRDMKGTIKYWNRGAEELYGWTKEEAVGRTTQDILKTRYPGSFEQVEEELLRTGHWEGELVHAGKDGEERIVSSRWALMREEGGPSMALEINSDISARKQSEQSLRQLSGYLMRAQDQERRRIARELHDSTGQKMFALKMHLDALGKEQGSSLKGSTAIAEGAKLADELIRDIRTLAQVLHPPLLDEAGLITATRWLTEGFSSRSGIPVEFVAPAEFERLPQDAEMTLFRIVQECLTNIHRHSGASKATIELMRNGNTVTLEISDDGKGMPRAARVNGQKERNVVGVGILGMRERLSQLGGKLEITGQKKGRESARVFRS